MLAADDGWSPCCQETPHNQSLAKAFVIQRVPWDALGKGRLNTQAGELDAVWWQLYGLIDFA